MAGGSRPVVVWYRMSLRFYRANPYGWIVVGVLFVVLSLVMASRSSLGLIIPIWEKELGWDRTFISTGGAVIEAASIAVTRSSTCLPSVVVIRATSFGASGGSALAKALAELV